MYNVHLISAIIVGLYIFIGHVCMILQKAVSQLIELGMKIKKQGIISFTKDIKEIDILN